MSYLLLETGDRIELEDDSGMLLMETGEVLLGPPVILSDLPPVTLHGSGGLPAVSLNCARYDDVRLKQ